MHLDTNIYAAVIQRLHVFNWTSTTTLIHKTLQLTHNLNIADVKLDKDIITHGNVYANETSILYMFNLTNT